MRNKKKILSLILILGLMVTVFTGCSVGKNDTDKKDQLVDGMYLFKEPVNDFGHYAMATLRVKDGEIEKLHYDEYFADSGEAKDTNNSDYVNTVDSIISLNAQYNEKQDMSKVDFDAVSEATNTKNSFRELTETLINNAKKGETYTPVYKDGIYKVKAEEENYGWLSEVAVAVTEGQIVGVDYQEIATVASDGVEVGDVKSPENYEYQPPFEVIASVRRMIIDNNGTEDIDATSGATQTRDSMLDLVNKAISTAK